MTLLNDSYDLVISLLEDAGLPVVDDVRNLRPPAVIVDPPGIAPLSASLVQINFSVTCVAPPPGNRDSMKKVLDLADVIIALPGLVTTGGVSGVYNVGNQDLPSYNLTITTTARRP